MASDMPYPSGNLAHWYRDNLPSIRRRYPFSLSLNNTTDELSAFKKILKDHSGDLTLHDIIRIPLDSHVIYGSSTSRGLREFMNLLSSISPNGIKIKCIDPYRNKTTVVEDIIKSNKVSRSEAIFDDSSM